MASNCVSDVMSINPLAFPSDATVREAAEEMRLGSIGDVLVEEDGEIRGIVTDRDIVIRCIAGGGDPDTLTLGSICSRDIATLSPSDGVDAAIELMKVRGVRRIPVVEEGVPVGILSLGDLAVDQEPRSALGSISAAAPNR